MHLVTLMNYDSPQAVLMCKAWIHLARRFHSTDQITILHGDQFEKIRPFAERHGIRCLYTSTKDIPTAQEWAGWNEKSDTFFPHMQLTTSVWRTVEEHGIDDFVFVEPDALILDSLTPLWIATRSKPFIGIAERARWDFVAPYMNMGVYAYNHNLAKIDYPPTGLMTYHNLLNFWKDCGKKITVPVGDQGLINAWFNALGYSPFHKSFGIEWNCLAANCMVIQADDQHLVVYSGNRPFMGECGFEFSNWIGWDQAKRVKVLHAFGPAWKPWAVPSMRRLWDYLGRKVAEFEQS